jgi:PAS domain S-box-containing protein
MHFELDGEALPVPSLGTTAAPAAHDVSDGTDVLFEVIPVALARFAADDALIAANRRARHLFDLDAEGRPSDETLATVFAPIYERLLPLVRATRLNRIAPAITLRFRAPPGEVIVELTAAALDDGGLLISASDVTARESLLGALERRARELAAIFEVSQSSVRVLDADGHIVRANSSAVNEYPGDRPRSLAELFERERPLHTTTRQRLRQDQHPAFRALRGEMVRGERYVVHRGSEQSRHILEMFAAPVRDSGHGILGAVIVSRDVTDQHRLAAELKEQVRRSAELNERVSTEAERLDRMVDERSRELLALQESRARDRRLSAVGQLAAGVMHDVNNALNPIMAAAWLLDHHANDPTAVRDYARRIAKAAETGAESAARVGRFLRQEPIDTGARRIVDLSVVAEEALQLMEPLVAERQRADARIEFTRDFSTQVTAHGVGGELREAALNLIQNAIDAMPYGGTMTLRTAVRDGQSVFEVSDTGVGMSDDVRDRAFEPFFSTKGAGGSGLGLSEVYGILRRHRGSVEITSVPDRGTTVHCLLPFAAAEPSPVVEPVRPSAVSRRILLVEDHADGREFMRRVLAEGGHRVEAVGTCTEARGRLSGTLKPYDVLITDIGLPDGSGWELVNEVRSSLAATHVGVVTGWEPTVRGTGVGAVDFILRKPMRAAELLASLARLKTVDHTADATAVAAAPDTPISHD